MSVERGFQGGPELRVTEAEAHVERAAGHYAGPAGDDVGELAPAQRCNSELWRWDDRRAVQRPPEVL